MSLNEALFEITNPANGVIDDYAHVRVINKGPTPVTWDYNLKKHRLNPDQEVVVPFYAMTMMCGDPRKHDVPGDMRHRDRSDEWIRLRTMYGIYDNTATMMGNLPSLEVYSLEGHRIITVIEDPYNDYEISEAESIEDHSTQQQATINHLTIQLQHAIAALDSQTKQGNVNSMPDTPENVDGAQVAPSARVDSDDGAEVHDADLDANLELGDATSAEDLVNAFQEQENKVNTEKYVEDDVATNNTPSGPRTPTPAPAKPKGITPKPRSTR